MPKKAQQRLKKSQLLRRLGVDRKTLDKYLSMEGAPEPDDSKTYDAAETVSFVSARCMVAGPSTVTQWKSRELELKCSALEDELARKRGEYISKAEASRTIIPLMTELGQLLRQLFVMELPSSYQGKDQVECSQINEQAVDQVIQRFRAGALPLMSA